MLVELVRTTTRDGVRLDAAFQAAGPVAAAAPLDGVCLVHGTGSNFYGSTLLEAFAERLAGLGCAVLRANTRGHDIISNASTAQGGRRLGAAYEVVDDCRHDLATWCEWLAQRAGPRIGHRFEPNVLERTVPVHYERAHITPSARCSRRRRRGCCRA